MTNRITIILAALLVSFTLQAKQMEEIQKI